MLSQTRQIASDRFVDVVERLFSRPPLTVAPRQRRTARYLPAVLIRLEHNQQSQGFAVVLILGSGIDQRGRAAGHTRQGPGACRRWSVVLDDVETESRENPMRVLCPEANRRRARDQPKDLLDWEAPSVELDKVLVPAIDRGRRPPPVAETPAPARSTPPPAGCAPGLFVLGWLVSLAATGRVRRHATKCRPRAATRLETADRPGTQPPRYDGGVPLPRTNRHEQQPDTLSPRMADRMA